MKREMIYFERPIALGMNFFGGWDKFAEKIRADEGNLEIGDIFPITLKSGREVELVVVGVNAYNKGEAIFSFANIFSQQPSAYIESALNIALDLLPDELVEVIKPRNEKKLWLFSRTEVFGKFGLRQEALPYFQRGKNRIKLIDDHPTNWWLMDDQMQWPDCFVTNTGGYSRYDDNTPNCLGVVPGFMI